MQVKRSVTGEIETLTPTQKQEGSQLVKGVYEAKFKTNKAATYTVTASYKNVPIATSASVNIVASAVPSPADSLLSADETSIDADNSSYSTITFAFKDFAGNGINPTVDGNSESTKLIISVGKKDSSGSISQWDSLVYEAKINSPGEYNAKFKTTTEGTYGVKVTYGGVDYATKSALEITVSNIVEKCTRIMV